MSPINMQCQGCGKAVQAPGTAAGKNVKCPSCGKPIQVPPAGPAADQGEGELELNCRDCGKVFSVALEKMGEVVNCPSCGSWIKAGQRRRSILERDIPMPFQVSSSVLQSLKFFAGFILIVGLAAAVFIGLLFGRTRAEPSAAPPFSGHIDIKPRLSEEGEPTGEFIGFIQSPERPKATERKVTDPMAMTMAFLLAIASVIASIVLMALYWIMRDVRALSFAIRQPPPKEE